MLSECVLLSNRAAHEMTQFHDCCVPAGNFLVWLEKENAA